MKKKLKKIKKKIKRRTALNIKIGKRLRSWRVSKRGEDGKPRRMLNQIAREIKVFQGTLSDIENGHNSASYKTLVKFLKVYGRKDFNRVFFSE